jgi:hypothetical protein
MATKGGGGAAAAASTGLQELKAKTDKLEVENAGLLERIRLMENSNKEIVAELRNRISTVQNEKNK